MATWELAKGTSNRGRSMHQTKKSPNPESRWRRIINDPAMLFNAMVAFSSVALCIATGVLAVATIGLYRSTDSLRSATDQLALYAKEQSDDMKESLKIGGESIRLGGEMVNYGQETVKVYKNLLNSYQDNLLRTNDDLLRAYKTSVDIAREQLEVTKVLNRKTLQQERARIDARIRRPGN
jgi:hypothetical protein